VIRRKTGRPVQFEITEQTRIAIGEWLAVLIARRGNIYSPAVANNSRTCPPAGTPALFIDGWSAAGLYSSAIEADSPARTKPAQINKKTGICVHFRVTWVHKAGERRLTGAPRVLG
jgi:hypothetical protein